MTATVIAPIPSIEAPAPAVARPLPVAVLKEMRPKQWAKNVLVFAAPGAAGVALHPGVMAKGLTCFAAFCLVASGTYFFNDLRDLQADRLHPKKRHRPIASGDIPVPTAVVMAALLVLAGFAVAARLGAPFVGVLAAYVAMTVSYSVWLKHVAVVDVAVVACGFVLRALAGGVGTHVAISQWFFIVAAAGSLFMVAGKRFAEHLELGDGGAAVRGTLGEYSTSYLRYLWMLASGLTITAYCLWAFEKVHAVSGIPWSGLSIAPFILAVLRYALLLENGKGSAPEDTLLGDRTLQALGGVWMVVFAAGVYLGH